MLKIKDNVNLKELEKFGLLYSPSCECYVDNYNFENICIYEKDRVIRIDINDTYTLFSFIENYDKITSNATRILYELIKSDIVEAL